MSETRYQVASMGREIKPVHQIYDLPHYNLPPNSNQKHNPVLLPTKPPKSSLHSPVLLEWPVGKLEGNLKL